MIKTVRKARTPPLLSTKSLSLPVVLHLRIVCYFNYSGDRIGLTPVESSQTEPQFILCFNPPVSLSLSKFIGLNQLSLLLLCVSISNEPNLFPSQKNTNEKMSSFSITRKKTPFQKHREEEEAKKKREQDETERLYAEFVESFQGDGSSKAFVRGGLINPNDKLKDDHEGEKSKDGNSVPKKGSR